MAIVGVTAELDDKIRFGLMTFPAFTPGGGDNDDDDDNECAPGTVNVPVGPGKGGDIAAALNMMDADGRTPTAASLQEALKVYGSTATADAVAARRYVLLVTDGDPNCSGGQGGRGGGGADQLARMQSIEAINALRMADVKTYVVGYQTAGTEFAQQLDMMAAAGGTGETMHRSVDNSQMLTEALQQLAGEVASCSYALTTPVDDAKYVRVTVADKTRAFENAADGWTLAPDRKTIELTGAACDEVRAGAPFAVQIECSEVPVF